MGMRRGMLPRLVFVGFLLIVSVAALSFSNINIGVGDLRIQRGGTGPLGMQLGLDLEGGVSLVYQAIQPPSIIRVTFEEQTSAATATSDNSTTPSETATEEPQPKITTDQVKEVVDGVLGLPGQTVEDITIQGGRSFTIRVSCLKAAARAGEDSGLNASTAGAIEQALLEKIGPISSFSSTPACEPPTEEQMEGVASKIERRVNEFGVTEPSIQVLGNERLLVQLPGIGDTKIRVAYTTPVTEEVVRGALEPLGRGDTFIEEETFSVFSIRTPSLQPARRDAEGTVVEPPEEESIRTALDEIGTLSSFTVTGGIAEAKRLIGQTALLEFKHRECLNEICSEFLDIDQDLTGDDLSEAYPDVNQTTNLPIVSLVFNSRGADLFGALTSRISERNEFGFLDQMPIYLDNEVLVSPVAREAILGGRAFIEGPDFTPERVRTIAIQLESGRLPVPITVIEERDVDATLGADALKKSLIGGYIGLGLVFLFMLFYYKAAGLMAGGALLAYTILVLAVFKLFPVTLTLAGVAGFILSIGMAVDANVLIFERMKEELRFGRGLLAAIETGFDRAWPSIRDSNVSTFITCIILWWFGTRLGASLVVGFSVTLFIGVAISMFSAIFISRTMMRLIARTPLARMTSLFTPVTGNLEPPAPRRG